jgi:hypothetical protein
MVAEKSKNRGGRPRQTPIKDGQKVQIGVRVSPAMQARLIDAAQRNGRSLTQEAEMRLERTFDRQDLLSEVLVNAFGRRAGGYLMLMARAFADAGFAAGRLADALGTETKDWTESKWAVQQAVIALNKAIEWKTEVSEYDDPQESKAPPLAVHHKMEDPGRILGKAVSDAVFGFTTTDSPYAEFGRTVRALIDIPEFLAKKMTADYEKKLAEGLRAEAKEKAEAKREGK